MKKKYIPAIINIIFLFVFESLFLQVQAQKICTTDNECNFQQVSADKNNIKILFNENSLPGQKGHLIIINYKSGKIKKMISFATKILLALNDNEFLLARDKQIFLVAKKKNFFDTLAHKDIDFVPYKALKKDNSLFIAGFDKNYTLKIIKTDLYLKIENQKKFSGDFYSKIYTLQSGNNTFLLSGMLKKNAFIIEFDYNLNIIWQNNTRSTRPSAYTSTIYTRDGGIIACGYCYPTQIPYADIQITKFDKTRKLKWSKNYGFKDEDKSFDIIETSVGYFLTGYTKIDGSRNLLTMRIDNSGNLLETQISPTKNDEVGKKLIKTKNDFIIIYYKIVLGKGGKNLYFEVI